MGASSGAFTNVSATKLLTVEKHSMPCAGAPVWSTAHRARPGADLGFARQPSLRTGSPAAGIPLGGWSWAGTMTPRALVPAAALVAVTANLHV